MEKISILDFISKLTGSTSSTPTSDEKKTEQTANSARSNTPPDQSDATARANAPAQSDATDQTLRESKVTQGEQGDNPRISESYMRSYNPFTTVQGDRKQITSPRAVVPPKSTIDLKNGKNLATEKKKDGLTDMIRFINRHNDLANRFNKKND